MVSREGASRELCWKRVGAVCFLSLTPKGFVCFWRDVETEKLQSNRAMRGCQTNADSKETKDGFWSLPKLGTEYTTWTGQRLRHGRPLNSSPGQTQAKGSSGHRKEFFPCDRPPGAWGSVARAVAALLLGARMWV